MKSINCIQKRAIDLWIRQGRRSKAQALREAGYSETVASQPNKVFKSKAVMEYLKNLGLNEMGTEYSEKPIIIETDIKPKTKSPAFDLSQITKEELQNLKEQLEQIPEVPTKNIQHSDEKIDIPIEQIYSGNMEGVFDISKQDLYKNNTQDEDEYYNDFSSM